MGVLQLATPLMFHEPAPSMPTEVFEVLDGTYLSVANKCCAGETSQAVHTDMCYLLSGTAHLQEPSDRLKSAWHCVETGSYVCGSYANACAAIGCVV